MRVNSALVYGLAIVFTYVAAVCAAVRRRDGKISLSGVVRFDGPISYFFRELRREGLRGALVRADLILFAACFVLLIWLFAIPVIALAVDKLT